MADEILECVATKEGSTVIQYDVAYKVMSGESVNQFCVTILASELTNTTDLNEVKTKANIKAKAIKDAWVADLPEYATEDNPSVVGAVSL